MSLPVIFRPEAQADLEETYAWYEEQRAGLGEDLLLCMEDALSKIRRHPEAYPEMHKGVRRALIRRFPYGVFYLVEEEAIVVIAVFHSRRDPRRWESRL